MTPETTPYHRFQRAYYEALSTLSFFEGYHTAMAHAGGEAASADRALADRAAGARDQLQATYAEWGEDLAGS